MTVDAPVRSSVPDPADYGVSPDHGFLPGAMPLARLPDPYYNRWEAIAGNLQSLVLSGRLRAVVDRLPVLSTSGLEHDAEWRRAYTLLTFFAHGYIWGGDSPRDRVPPSISVPLLAVCAHLELPPVSTYAASVLWNWKPLFVDEPIDDLDNLATLVTFTGSLDESWFYLVSVSIEARGGPIVPLMLAAIAAARAGDSATVTRCLQAFAERLDGLGTMLRRMHDHCDPAYFYGRIRTFLAGSKNMADAGLPHGVVYDDGSGAADYVQWSGPSNAQSSLIQFFDIVLGIQHRPTAEKGASGAGTAPVPKAGPGAAPSHNFIRDMRRYMPGPHARFLERVENVANIRQFVEARKDTDRPLSIAYDACLAMLQAFRDIHLGIVSRYVIVPSRQKKAATPAPVRAQDDIAPSTQGTEAHVLAPAGTTQQPQNLATASRNTQQRNVKGTGGTALIPFLKQARDETGEPGVGDWARRFMTRQTKAGASNGRGAADFRFGKHGDGDGAVFFADTELLAPPPAVGPGFAGSWTADDEVGGLCSY